MRKYDDVTGRFTSIDPLWEQYRSWSPYVYSYNNPVQFVDPSGESGEAVVEGDQIVVYSDIYFYTNKGEEGLIDQNEAHKIALEIMEEMNGKTVKIGNEEYTVKFHITAKVVSLDDVEKMRTTNTDDRVNFVKIVKGEKQGESWMEGNSGVWGLLDRDCKTYIHEWIHGLGYQSHDPYILGSGKQPDMMIEQGARVDAPWSYPDGTIDPSTRYVSQRNIDNITANKPLVKERLIRVGISPIGSRTNIPEPQMKP